MVAKPVAVLCPGFILRSFIASIQSRKNRSLNSRPVTQLFERLRRSVITGPSAAAYYC
jgi:hypothetical protein